VQAGVAADSLECGGSLPALALDGVSGHHLNHVQVQNDAGVLARVTGGSTGAIGPHRRPAPEGGGAAAPASLRVRCCARREEKLGREYCSPRAEEVGGLTGREEAAAEGLGDGGGSGGAPVSSGRGCHGRRGRRLATARACQAPGDPKNQRKRAGVQSFTDGDGSTVAAETRGSGAGKLRFTCACWCVAEAKGGAGVRARA
jgi:hypothetical protein